MGRKAVCITKELESQLVASFAEMARAKPMEYFASMDIRCFGFHRLASKGTLGQVSLKVIRTVVSQK